MPYLELIILAIALSMDSFAVSISIAACHPNLSLQKQWKIAATFGLFHIFMPIIGYFTCSLLHESILEYDFWMAATILMIIGIKMMYEAFGDKEECIVDIGWKRLLFLAVATSIDVFAVGLTFSLLEYNMMTSVIIIGIVVTLISFSAFRIGKLFSKKFSSKTSTIIGSLIIMGIGIKIILENILV